MVPTPSFILPRVAGEEMGILDYKIQSKVVSRALKQVERTQTNFSEGKMALLIVDYLKAFGWGVVGALTMAVSLWILVKVFTWLTPVDEWDELRKGNIGIAIVMASVIIGFAIVVGSMVAPPPIASVTP
jgi:Domain of Unknown Function (DUF350)